MNTTNSSLLLSLDYLNYMTTLAAISYIIVGVISLVFVTYIHLSMRQIKEAQQGNSFYFYSSHSLLCDQANLFLLFIYVGVVLSGRNPDWPPEFIGKIVGVVFMLNFNLKGLFLVFICWTRLVSIRSQSIVSIRVGKQARRVSCMIWLVTLVLSVIGSRFSCIRGIVSFQELGWILSVDESKCGFIMSVLDLSYVLMFMLGLSVLNLATVVVYVRKRKNFVTVLSPGCVGAQNLQNHQKRERNLFIQCSSSTVAYLVCMNSFWLTSQLKLLPGLHWHLVSTLIQSVVSLDTSLIYVMVNRELRHEMCRLTIKKIFAPQTAH